MIKTDEYTIAYTELSCLLDYIPKNYYNKIPSKYLELLKFKSRDEYRIKIDTSKSLEEQNLSRKTKILLAVLKYNYWCENAEEKKKLSKQFQDNELKYQRELMEKYNPDNIFKQNNENSVEKREVALTETKKGNLIDRIMKFFSRIFKNR